LLKITSLCTAAGSGQSSALCKQLDRLVAEHHPARRSDAVESREAHHPVSTTDVKHRVTGLDLRILEDLIPDGHKRGEDQLTRGRIATVAMT
jgi:hypothetical protein